VSDPQAIIEKLARIPRTVPAILTDQGRMEEQHPEERGESMDGQTENDRGRILLTLDGPPGEIAAKGLQKALDHLMVLVRDAGKVLGVSGGEWRLFRLELGSAMAGIENPAALGVPLLIDQGQSELAESAVIPRGWTLAMLRADRDLGLLAGKLGIHAVRLDAGRDRTLSGAIAANADLALQVKHRSLGTVRGRLDKYSSRNGHRDLGMLLDTGDPLAVTFSSDDLGKKARGLLETDVVAWGLVERNVAQQRIALRLEGIEAAPARGLPVPLHDVVGLYADLFPGMTAEEIVKAVRGNG